MCLSHIVVASSNHRWYKGYRVDAGIMRHKIVNFYNSQMKCGKATQLGINKLYL